MSEKRGATSTFYHSDIKNSVEQTSTSQTVSASKQYDAFGNEVSSSGSWQGPFQYGGAFGYHTDTDYGLKHLGARYYDPTTGRFLSRDPIKDGRNWYGYCGGNPLVPHSPNEDREGEWQDVYRLYGGDSRKWGEYWAPEDPRNDPDFRTHYGIGKWNTGEWIVNGQVPRSEEGVTWFPGPARDPITKAPLGNGMVEIRIPSPRSTVRNPVIMRNPPGFHGPSPWD